MSNSFIQQFKQDFLNGSAVNKLLTINLAVFAVVVLIMFVDWVSHAGRVVGWSDSFADLLSISSDWRKVLLRFWSPFTCIFLHQGFGHILFNMIGLLMFGNIVGDLIGDRRVFPIYLLGGLVGNLFFFISANLVYNPGIEHLALGASGAVMALAGAAVAISPDYRVGLLLFGMVPLKYIVLVMVLADMVGIAGNINTGGHFAHIGGLLFGYLFVQRLHTGKDISEGVHDMADRLTGWLSFSRPKKKKSRKHEPTFKVVRGGRTTSSFHARQTRQEALDAILDKIRLQGMASLTDEEKQFLDSHKDS